MDSKYVAGVPEIARFDFSRLKAGQDKTQNGINKAALYLWSIGQGDHGMPGAFKSFEDLTRKQKLDLVGNQLDLIIMGWVREQLYSEGREITRSAVEADLSDNY